MDNYVITIARGFGSGGKEIGKKLAEIRALNTKFEGKTEVIL